MKVVKTGGTPVPIATGTGSSNLATIAVDASWVYWTNRTPARRAPSYRGRTAPRGSRRTAPAWFGRASATDSTPDGTVMRIAKSGGTPEPLATNLDSPLFIWVDAQAVYWTSSATANGTVTMLAK